MQTPRCSQKFCCKDPSQWAWTAFGWTWDEHEEWLLLQLRTLLGLLENTKKKNFQLALFEKIQFLCFLKLKIAVILTHNRRILLPKGSVSIKLREKAQITKKSSKEAKKIFSNWSSLFDRGTKRSPIHVLTGLNAAATLKSSLTDLQKLC